MSQYLRKDLYPPSITAGIRTMKCGSCDFEFVYIVPEETNAAELTIAEHLHMMHEGNFLTKIVEVTQH